MERCSQCRRPILPDSALAAGGGMPEYCLALEGQRDVLADAAERCRTLILAINKANRDDYEIAKETNDVLAILRSLGRP